MFIIDTLFMLEYSTGPNAGSGPATRASVGSLESPRIVVSLEIPVFQILFLKKSEKIVKICFLDSQDQKKIWICLWFSKTTSMSYINPLFRAPSLLKPLNSSSRYQNLPREPLTAHSDHRGTPFRPGLPPKTQFVRPLFALFDLCSPYMTLS